MCRLPGRRIPKRRWAGFVGLPLMGFALTLMGFALPTDAAEAVKPLGRTISASRQFVIYAEDTGARLKLSAMADEAATVWREWLGVKKEWKYPIILNFPPNPKGRPRDAFRTTLAEADGGEQKIQIEVLDSSLMFSSAMRAEIFRALTLEYSYRDSPLRAGKSYRLAPDWLAEGLAEEMRSREEGLPARVVEGLLNAPKKPKVMDLLRARPPTIPLERDFYRIFSLAFIRTLPQLPEGREGIRQLISQLPESEITPEQILRTFPSLQFDLSRLDKEWTLTLAKIASGTRLELMGFEATSEAIQRVFAIKGPEDPKNPEAAPAHGTQALSDIARSPSGPRVLREVANQLLQLETRAHPIYRPIIAEYRTLVYRLIQKPKTNIKKRLQQNDELFLLLSARSKEVSDYLNWFEVNKLQAPDESFLDSVRAEPNLPVEDQPKSEITQQLDAMEQSGW